MPLKRRTPAEKLAAVLRGGVAVCGRGSHCPGVPFFRGVYMQANVQIERRQATTVHPVDEMLPWTRLCIYGLQHVLAMYAGALAIPLIVAGAIGLSKDQLIYLINADLFTCGMATLIQTLGLGRIPVGIKIPLIQGCTFAAVTPMILIGKAYGLRGIYGSIIIAGLITLIISPYYSRILYLFPPVVTGSIITIIGISLLPVAVGWSAGVGPSAPTFGSLPGIALTFAV